MDSAIILCAGSGSRAGLDYNKIFYPLGASTVLDTVINRFLDFGFGRIILAASSVDLERVRRLYPNLCVVEGGTTRSDSVRNALRAAEGSEVVAIHDAARPFVSFEVIARAMDSARKSGSGIPAVRSIDHVCMGKDTISEYLPKERLFCIQTPQCFRFLEILDAYNRVTGSFADDSEVYMRAGFSPTLTEGDYKNKKLTTPADFAGLSHCRAISEQGSAAEDKHIAGAGLSHHIAAGCSRGFAAEHKHLTGAGLAAALAGQSFAAEHNHLAGAGLAAALAGQNFAAEHKHLAGGGLGRLSTVGIGFDVHRLVEGRRLILGGVEIPCDKGLLGHSDADVLAHALSDAILSAAGKPDIGVLFPDSDPAFLGADSMTLLDAAHGHLLLADKKLAFVSCVIIAQKPKLAGFIPSIRESIAERLGLSVDLVNISATTTEFLGIIGEGNAIAASAAVLCG